MTDIKTLKTNDVNKRKSGFRRLAEGFACEWKEMTADMKEQLGMIGNAMKEDVLAPFKIAKDIKKGCKLIAKGKFRELRGKVAQRLASNLQTLGIIGDKTYERMASNTERNSGVKKVEASDHSKAHGELVRPIMSTYRQAFTKLFKRDR